MARLLGRRIPDEYEPEWSSDRFKDQEEYWIWYMCGYEDGSNGEKLFQTAKADKLLRLENEKLKGELQTLSKTKQDLAEEYEFIKKITDKYVN